MRRSMAHAAFGIVAAVCGAMAAYNGLQLTRANRVNELIARAAGPGTSTSTAPPARDAGSDIDTSTVPQARLAAALRLAKAGKFTAALKAYKALLEAPDEVRLPAL